MSPFGRTPTRIFLGEFILKVFGKTYGRNFRTISFSCRLHYRLPFLNYIMEQMIIIILCHILLIFKYHIKGKTHTKYRYSDSQRNKSKGKGEQISLVTSNKIEAYKRKWYVTDNILSVT